jgi:cytidylate kinase
MMMVERGRVLILTGPPGSGKTTVAEIVASRFERSVHLVCDDFFHFIRSGYIEPWRPESHAQNTVVMGTVGDAATSYADGGYLTIVDGIILPGWFYEPLHERLEAAGLKVTTVVLWASIETCIRRVRRRDTDALRDPAVVEKLWLGFSKLGALESHVIDTETDEPEATADVVLGRVSLAEVEKVSEQQSDLS